MGKTAAKPTNKQIAAAVRLLEKAADGKLVLKSNRTEGVYLFTSVHTEESARHFRESGYGGVRKGVVEYRVGNGPPDDCSRTSDFDTLKEALEFFGLVEDIGWHEVDNRAATETKRNN